MPLIIPYKEGLSIGEQKCYLMHEGNSDEIIKCLELLQVSPWIIIGTVVVFIAILTFLLMRT